MPHAELTFTSSDLAGFSPGLTVYFLISCFVFRNSINLCYPCNWFLFLNHPDSSVWPAWNQQSLTRSGQPLFSRGCCWVNLPHDSWKQPERWRSYSLKFLNSLTKSGSWCWDQDSLQSAAAASASAPVLAQVALKPRVPTTPLYDGDPKACCPFLSQRAITFNLQ